MATAIEPRIIHRDPPAEQRVVIHDVDWATYQQLAEAIGDQAIRLAYDQGELELMSPGPAHEFDKTLFGRLIEVVTEELEIPCAGMGSTLWEREAHRRGLEPDECYYFNAGKLDARAEVAKRRLNRSIGYPMPDLAIEVEITSPLVRRMAIYASLGVPEVWRFDGETLRIMRLREDGTYESRPDSQFLPILPDEVMHWLLRVDSADQSSWARQFRAWARATLAPRQRDRRP